VATPALSCVTRLNHQQDPIADLDRNLIAGRECGRALHGEKVAVLRSVCEVLFL